MYLNLIFCACLKFGYFPKAWKNASVTTFKKTSKDPSKASSYRPISLLSAISKLFEKIILTRINMHVQVNNLIPEEQYGFRLQRSTTKQLIRFIDCINTAFNNRQSAGALFFDIEMAFDRVWHDGLLYKMIGYHFPTYLIKITSSFLSNRQFRVKIDNTKSAFKPIPFGVPRGAVLSPALYNIHTSDMPLSDDCFSALFADDIALVSTSGFYSVIENTLQLRSNDLLEYFNKWKIVLNNQKTLLYPKNKSKSTSRSNQFAKHQH